MRGFHPPQMIVDRVIARRGAAHIHANFDGSRTALLAIDLQNAFLTEAHSPSPIPGALTILPCVNRLAEALRHAGGGVFWIKHAITAETQRTWSSWFALNAFDEERARRRIATLSPGHPGYELHPDLNLAPSDEIVAKQRFSAFIGNSSDLHERLTKRGFDTVLIAGVLTNVCVESTARDAMMMNYKTIVVSDATAAPTEAEHNAALTSLYSTFGDVLDTDSVLERSSRR